jgi:dipeptidyl aminopeptidase/acylaminoacyl peptidase
MPYWLLGEARDYSLPLLIGQREADQAMLKAHSAVTLAARITQPLLLAYGGVDRRVPIEHGKRFYQAVQPFNPDVKWIEYGDEGHGWFMPKTNIDFWGRVERFLARQIGPSR